MEDLNALQREFEEAQVAHEDDPTDGDKHRQYVFAMQQFADARREWRRQEEEAGRRVPGVIAEVND